MSFFWPMGRFVGFEHEGMRCSATMISDRVAVTAAHCLRKFETGKIKKKNRAELSVLLNGGNGIRAIKEVRVDDCWNFKREGPWSNDLAMLFFDKPIENAVKGVDYVEIWNPADHRYEDLTGAEIIVAGWGWNG